MEPRKLTREDIDKVRHIDGFPIAKDEDIIALSNAPYHTACPNPFIEDFIKKYGSQYDEKTDDYRREPFAADVSEGKNDPVYNAHSYHTKVPHKAIMRYILHYTNPGDVIFDGFCGSGMTGVAAQLCDDEKIVRELGYSQNDKGLRNVVLNDISPFGTLLSNNYNSLEYFDDLHNYMDQLIKEVVCETNWMYKTKHIVKNESQLNMNSDEQFGILKHIYWSQVFICPECSGELVYWDIAVDRKDDTYKKEIKCPHCNVEITKRSVEPMMIIEKNNADDKMKKIIKEIPVLIKYEYNSKLYEKVPDCFDIELMERVNNSLSQNWFPPDKIDDGDETRRNFKYGITNVADYYSKRTLLSLSLLYSKIDKNPKYRNHVLFLFTSICGMLATKRLVFHARGMKSNNLYLPSVYRESNISYLLTRKYEDYIKPFFGIKKSGNYIVSTGSSTNLINIPTNTIDYIFIDPPFGANISYSELSILWESWLKVKTNNIKEAIVNKTQCKGLFDYEDLMHKSLSEFYRIIKPNRWITIEFHNSKNSVWNSLQNAIMKAGFIIVSVKILDKKQGSFLQMSTSGSVQKDLVISAYKPKESFKNAFLNHAGSVETAWDFVADYLEKVTIVNLKNGRIEIIPERLAILLFDKMVAYHIMSGIAVPIDAIDFYKGLDEKFLKRDGMYFLPDQINEYDTVRITNDVEPIQFELFVTNEKSAIAWLYQQLDNPQTYAELQPKFMQEIKAWDKFEERPELNTLLEENFLQNEDGKWYVPDVTKAADVLKLREKKLLKEFEGYLTSKGKLKLFRAEAVRVGFAKLWTDKNYKLIVETADRLPESVIQEDDKLLMYYDISLGRI